MGNSLEQALDILRDATPLGVDCGQYCDCACCKPDADGQGGVYLFPGEAERLRDQAWAHTRATPDLGGCALLTCAGTCERAMRPLGCRLFPLTPIRRAGQWDVRLDQRAWAMCPLMRGGRKGLNPAFVEAARRAVRLLAEDPECEAFMRRWAKQERQFAEAEL